MPSLKFVDFGPASWRHDAISVDRCTMQKETLNILDAVIVIHMGWNFRNCKIVRKNAKFGQQRSKKSRTKSIPFVEGHHTRTEDTNVNQSSSLRNTT